MATPRDMSTSTPGRMRWMLRVLLLLGVAGLGAELLLTGHTEGLDQLLPLIALAVAVFALALDVFSRSRLGTGVMRLAMVGVAAVGGWGLWLHYESNAEFQRELHPQRSAWEHFAGAMRATSPPSLAPGTMALLGGIGLISTCGAGAARGRPEGDE